MLISGRIGRYIQISWSPFVHLETSCEGAAASQRPNNDMTTYKAKACTGLSGRSRNIRKGFAKIALLLPSNRLPQRVIPGQPMHQRFEELSRTRAGVYTTYFDVFRLAELQLQWWWRGSFFLKTTWFFKKKEQKLEFISVIKNILSLCITQNPIFSRLSNLCGLKLDNLVDFIQFLLHH